MLKRVLEDFASAEAAAAAAASTSAATAAAAGAPAPPPGREGLALKGFATFSCRFQTMENAALRKALFLADGDSGVLIYRVPRVSNLHGVLEENDVLVAVDGEKISNDGRIKRGDNSPTDFRVCVTMKLCGERIRYSIVRKGVKAEVEVAAEREPELTPATWYGSTTYTIFAGLVFVPATDAVEWPVMHAPSSRTAFGEAGRKHEHAHQQLPTLVTILPHSVMLGYEARVFTALEPLLAVDDVDVLCLADVYRLTKASAGPFTTCRVAGGRRIVLPTAEGRAATLELMNEHRITHEASSDVLAAAGGAVGSPP